MAAGSVSCSQEMFYFLCGVGLCVGGRAGGPVRGWVLLLVRERSERWGLRAGGIDCLLTCESRRRQHTSGCFLSLSLYNSFSQHTLTCQSLILCLSLPPTYIRTYFRPSLLLDYIARACAHQPPACAHNTTHANTSTNTGS